MGTIYICMNMHTIGPFCDCCNDVFCMILVAVINDHNTGAVYNEHCVSSNYPVDSSVVSVNTQCLQNTDISPQQRKILNYK